MNRYLFVYKSYGVPELINTMLVGSNKLTALKKFYVSRPQRQYVVINIISLGKIKGIDNENVD